MTLGAGFAAIITTSTSNYPGLVNAANPDLRAGPGLQDIFADFFLSVQRANSQRF